MENPQAEPSMEEILASIRRIISEDDEESPARPETAGSVMAQKTEKKPVELPLRSEASLDDDTAKPHLETEDVEMVKKNVTAAAGEDTEETILDRASADAASQAFLSLSQSVRVSDGEGRTLEDIVTRMLKPMIKDWLDANLPAIVEEKVEEEVQRVARRRG